MSKIALSPNASGTGVFTIASPNGNTDRTLTLPDEAGTVLTTAGVPASAMPSGSVIQVVSNWSDTQSSATTGWVTAISASITPQFSTSKILIIVNAPFSCTTDTYGGTQILRGVGGGYTPVGTSTNVGVGSSDSNWWLPIDHRDSDAWWESELVSGNYLDTPNTTSTIEYLLQYKVSYGSTIYHNRPVEGSNASYHWNATSTMTLMEIAV